MPDKKKRKPTKPERREARLNRARQWAAAYQGNHLVRDYRKKFKVDPACALRDLGEIGAIEPEKLAVMQKAKQKRRESCQRKREEKKRQAVFDRYPDSDDLFFSSRGIRPAAFPTA